LRERSVSLFERIAAGSPGRAWQTVSARDCLPSLFCAVARDMTKPDGNLRMNEELQEADPIPDAFPGQDPKVDQEWEKAKEDPMGGESPSS